MIENLNYFEAFLFTYCDCEFESGDGWKYTDVRPENTD